MNTVLNIFCAHVLFLESLQLPGKEVGVTQWLEFFSPAALVTLAGRSEGGWRHRRINSEGMKIKKLHPDEWEVGCRRSQASPSKLD